MINRILERLEEEREYSYADFCYYLMKYELDNDFEVDDDWFYKGLIRAKKIVQEVAKEYDEKKPYKIALVCLEDTTSLEMELTEQEYLFLEKISNEVSKIATGCMPTMYVEQKGE